ncbi:alpha/beta hydrolase [Lysobacter sp. SG-8]|uniref:Alpha/beta hydrolase n=1 Tax=Marilutibacter penaei TaxID=2759900 RepID=A0A7W3YDZ1_9GAMM|nr:alpha/beta hydrolase [Lysobacter penaei]MBB1087661.1 alpha/beta hydrolase [Lysobacter penaei]
MAESARGGRIVALGLLAFALLGYAAVCAFLYLKQRELVYFPQVTKVEATRTDFALENDGEVLRGWVVNPGQPRALLYFGGNAEAIQLNREAFADWFPGHTVYLLAYRGYGASSGAPDEDALVSDALALHAHAARRHAGIDVIGRSLGSGVAAQLAARRPVDRLALVTPFDSLVATAAGHYPWVPVRGLMRDRFDSAGALATHAGPVLVIRGERDTLVPPPRTQALVEALPSPPLEVVLRDAGHNGFDGRPEYRQALQAFLGPVD